MELFAEIRENVQDNTRDAEICKEILATKISGKSAGDWSV